MGNKKGPEGPISVSWMDKSVFPQPDGQVLYTDVIGLPLFIDLLKLSPHVIEPEVVLALHTVGDQTKGESQDGTQDDNGGYDEASYRYPGRWGKRLGAFLEGRL